MGKHTLFIISMVIGLNCWGQQIVGKTHDSTSILLNTFSAGLMGGVAIQPKQDTVKVLMLVCDTTDYPQDTRAYFRTQDQMIHNGKVTWWQFGYEVREGWNAYRINQDRTKTPMFTIKEYLDQNKKQLPKSLVVWITKEIK